MPVLAVPHDLLLNEINNTSLAMPNLLNLVGKERCEKEILKYWPYKDWAPLCNYKWHAKKNLLKLKKEVNVF